ncbi:hypothetical protein [Mycoplasmopsis gallinacea]|uniref:Transglutaminase-like domain-containing protein n=1 Tax=Mycoplasmopsis gallinacea TaxID=29556 RepID=A0A6H0V777_9BACT|nr:hypothetical protein [Mycoplasmopsis gallinacea]QIW62345.1 hypothetical protein GOQ20_02835 [Mycoplasmopsis gallinacea]
MKKWKLILPLFAFGLVFSAGVSAYFVLKTNNNNVVEKTKKEEINTQNIEILKKAYLKYQEIQNKDFVIRNFENEFLTLYNDNVKKSVEEFYNQNYSKLTNITLKNFYTKWKYLILDKYLLEIDKKTVSIRDEKILSLKNIFNEIDRTSENLIDTKIIELSKRIANINEFEEFIKDDFNTFFTDENNEQHWAYKWYSAEFRVKSKNNNTYWISPFSKISLDNLKNEFNEHFAKFKEDAWMVVPREDLVDVSNFSLDQVPAFYTETDYDWMKWTYKKLRYISLEEMNLDRWIDDSRLNEEQRDTLNKKVSTRKNILLKNIKDIVGATINKNWDVVKIAKALAKYLIIKNDYLRAKKNQWEPMTFLSLKDEISHFNCQGYSEFIYMSLKLLGFEKVGFEDRYFYKENKQDVNHVNNIYDLDGKRYIIDATFADKYNSSDNDLSTLEEINFFINKFIFVPINDYLNHEPLAPFYVAKSTTDKTEIVFK